MNFGVMQTEMFQQAGLDSADTTVISNVKRWLNFSQQDIAMRYPWPFLRTRESIATVVDKTAGTVSVTAGATSVTGSGTNFTASDVGSYIQFDGANDWYRVSARSSTTAITIDTAYAPTANLSAATYTLRKFLYSLSSSVDRILDIKNWEKAIRFVNTDFGTLDWITGANMASGGPSAYAMYGLDSSGNIQLTFYPFPTTPQIYEVRYLKRLSDLSADADLSVIPVKWHHVIVEGALIYAFQYLRKFDLVKNWTEYYASHLSTMMQNCKESLDEVPVLRAIDQFHKSDWIRLPGEFPVLGNAGD